MSDRAFYALLALTAVTLSPVFAFAALLALGTVNFHDVLHLAVFAAVLLHLYLARRDRRADHRAARQAAHLAWRSTVRPRFTASTAGAPADRLADDHVSSWAASA